MTRHKPAALSILLYSSSSKSGQAMARPAPPVPTPMLIVVGFIGVAAESF